MYPTLFYRDAPAAMEWLQRAFGFEEIIRVPGEDGSISHAEMHLGGAVIMLGSAGMHGRNYRSPLDLAGMNQATYVYIEDPEAHYRRAGAAGAEITDPLEAKDYGGSGYSCRDVEGHEWSFGSYRPEVPA
jgi:uncharacterized glyoxalase superfamily protein PhnB